MSQGIATADLGLSIRDMSKSRKAHHVGGEPAYDRHSIPGSPGAARRENAEKEKAEPDEQDTAEQEDARRLRARLLARQPSSTSAFPHDYMRLTVFVHEGQDVLVEVNDLVEAKYEEKFKGTLQT
jgi:hypothetical protein